MTCEEIEGLANAYVDDELDLGRTLGFEAHLSRCEACTARLNLMRGLSRALRKVPYFRAPRELAARIPVTVGDTAVPPARQQRHGVAIHWGWQMWVLSAASLVASSFVLAVALHERTVMADDATTEAVIEGHVRSLMAGHLMDVVSADGHTVKPWFGGRLDFSPTVVDLAGDGFPLVGGRLDYIDRHRAAALVYRRQDHVINVFVWPQPTGSPSHATRADGRGYHVVAWARDGVAVWIVSDLALSELDDFGRRLDAAVDDR